MRSSIFTKAAEACIDASAMIAAAAVINLRMMRTPSWHETPPLRILEQLCPARREPRQRRKHLQQLRPIISKPPPVFVARDETSRLKLVQTSAQYALRHRVRALCQLAKLHWPVAQLPQHPQCPAPPEQIEQCHYRPPRRGAADRPTWSRGQWPLHGRLVPIMITSPESDAQNFPIRLARCSQDRRWHGTSRQVPEVRSSLRRKSGRAWPPTSRRIPGRGHATHRQTSACCDLRLSSRHPSNRHGRANMPVSS